MNRKLSMSLWFLFLLGTASCTKEIGKADSITNFLFINEVGDFKLNSLCELQDGKILVAGSTLVTDFTGTTAGTDTGVFYIIDPETRDFKRIKKLSLMTGYVYGVVGSAKGGLYIHYENFNKQGSSLILVDKFYNEVMRVPTNAYLSPDNSSENAVNTLQLTKNGDLLLLKNDNTLSKYRMDLSKVWTQKTAPDYQLESFKETADESIAVVGRNSKTIPSNMGLLKFNVNGDLEFISQSNNTSGLSSNYQDILVVNGNYLVSGTINLSTNALGQKINRGTADAVVVKYNSKGDSLSSRIISTPFDDDGLKLIPTADNGYIFLRSVEKGSSTRVINLIKLDADLNEIWVKEIGKSGESSVSPLGLTLKDGSIVIGCYGSTRNNSYTGADAFLIFLDKNGDL